MDRLRLAAEHAAVELSREIPAEHNPKLVTPTSIQVVLVLPDRRPHRFLIRVEEV